MSEKNWLVCCGSGAEYRAAFNTLDEALRYVAARIVAPRGNCCFEWHCQMDATGEVDYYSWECATRKFTEADAESRRGEFGDIPKSAIDAALRGWVNSAIIEDEAATRDRCEFPSGFVASVAVTHVHRERRAIARSDAAGNDNVSRWREFARLVKS